MQDLTIKSKLVAYNQDGLGYITYVFENINYKDEFDRYIMCVRFPNWEHKSVELNKVGFLNIRYVEEGVDKWFDGINFNTYKYTNIIFMKFIEMKEIPDTKNILLD